MPVLNLQFDIGDRVFIKDKKNENFVITRITLKEKNGDVYYYTHTNNILYSADKLSTTNGQVETPTPKVEPVQPIQPVIAPVPPTTPNQ